MALYRIKYDHGSHDSMTEIQADTVGHAIALTMPVYKPISVSAQALIKRPKGSVWADCYVSPQILGLWK